MSQFTKWERFILLLASLPHFPLINSTYHDAEVVRNIAENKMISVVVLVRWEKLTKQFIVNVRKGVQVE